MLILDALWKVTSLSTITIPLSDNPMDHFAAFEFELVALFLALPLKNGWRWVKTARNLNLGVSRNRCCDFLADPDSRSFSRFGAIIMHVAVVGVRLPEA